MFAKSILAIAVFSISTGSSFASEYSAPFADVVSSSTLTRAAVQQELYRAQAAGVVSGEYYGTPAAVRSTRSRTDVERELQQAQASGQIVSGELYGQLPAVAASSVSRQQVRADAVAFATRQAHSHPESTSEFIGG